MKPIIEVENLGKRYRLGRIGAGSLRDELENTWRRLRGEMPPEDERDFWALRAVSFTVNEGEVLGVIGRNGAGKSTLLKLLSRITEPTTGRAVLRGRVASLLEVGTGFHPELSGRENIFLNGAVLGMTRVEVLRKFDEIVDFSGVEKFLDTPVKRYSSGMRVRLGFAVAAFLEPEILIVDEVLAVGDFSFQQRCLGRMQKVSESGRTVIFVSHNMGAVAGLCTRCVLLSDGQLADAGETRRIIDRYIQSSPETGEVGKAIPSDRDEYTLTFEIPTRFTYRTGERIVLSYTIEGDTEMEHPSTGIVFSDNTERGVMGMSTRMQRVTTSGKKKKWHFECDLRDVPLMPGTYFLKIYFGGERGNLTSFSKCAAVSITDSDPLNAEKELPRDWGCFYWTPEWKIL